jgi:hypothetical protein
MGRIEIERAIGHSRKHALIHQNAAVSGKVARQRRRAHGPLAFWTAAERRRAGDHC